MFVRQSTYDKEVAEALVLKLRLNNLIDEWNTLIRRINKLGGEDFLQRGEVATKQSIFTEEDLTKLIQLCHPDKHQGKPLATEMTQKLLQLKKVL